ncbi:RDD family protein [Phycisphaerales bacterium AB-hyl4]|uniref:RDD family protein n=1 Tax=Natronomicrosphaera hydrolytica TaxID=3242702 RepID=A0ABV4UBV7_9BACT
MMRMFVIWAAMAALMCGGEAAAWAVSVAAEGRHVWIAQPWDDEAGTLIAHHGPGDSPGVLGQVREVSRTVSPGGVAARGQTVYVIYTNGTLQRFDGQRAGVEQHWRYTARPGPSLPRDVTLRGFGVGRGGPWALVRAADADAARRLDSPGADRPGASGLSEREMLRNLQLGLPPNLRRTPMVEPEAEADDEAADGDAADAVDDAAEGDVDAVGEADANAGANADADADADAVPAAADEANEATGLDRLLRLRAGRWVVTPLPSDWPSDGDVRLVTTAGASPRLVVAADGGLDVYGWDEEEQAWQSRHYDVPVSERWSAVAVDGHLVVAWQTSPTVDADAGEAEEADVEADASALRVEAAVLRHGRVRPIGAMELPGRQLAWDVAGVEGAVWLVGQHTRATRVEGEEPLPGVEPLWRWTSLDLQGSVGTTMKELRWREPAGIGSTADYYIMVGVLVSAVMLMLLFWRRDAAANQLSLPNTLELGALGRRFMAAGLDLLPAVVLVMTTYGLTLPEMMMRWPGSGAAASWQAIEPGVLVVVLFVLYTTFAELLMRRTVGKVIFGLRVSDLHGKRPRVWQLLVRNVLKSFDLVAWPLLILLVLGPYRQRLGDLVARTVVVSPVERDEAEGGDGDGEGDGENDGDGESETDAEEPPRTRKDDE